MFIAVWVGYFVYGMTFSHHISTHDYYQLPFVPAVAIGIAAAAQVVINKMRAPKVVLYSLVIGVTLFWVTMNAWDVRVKLKRDDFPRRCRLLDDARREAGRQVIGEYHPGLRLPAGILGLDEYAELVVIR